MQYQGLSRQLYVGQIITFATAGNFAVVVVVSLHN